MLTAFHFISPFFQLFLTLFFSETHSVSASTENLFDTERGLKFQSEELKERL